MGLESAWIRSRFCYLGLSWDSLLDLRLCPNDFSSFPRTQLTACFLLSLCRGLELILAVVHQTLTQRLCVLRAVGIGVLTQPCPVALNALPAPLRLSVLEACDRRRCLLLPVLSLISWVRLFSAAVL